MNATIKTPKILSTERMWRTLVRVERVLANGNVDLIIPGRNVHLAVMCPKAAIPPYIYKTMKKGERYHVECNIGAKYDADLCFDRWEAE